MIYLVWCTNQYDQLQWIVFRVLDSFFSSLLFSFHHVWSIVRLTSRCLWSQWTQPKHYGREEEPMGRDVDIFDLRSTMLNSIEVEAVEIKPVVEGRPTGYVTACHSHGICGHLVADVAFQKEWLRARISCSRCIHGSFKKMGTKYFASD